MNLRTCLLSICLLQSLFAISVNAQSYTYTFETPVFTANETAPILNRLANVGSNDFNTSFTSSPTANGFIVESFLTAPLTGLSLHSVGVNTLTLTFSRPVISLSFGAATGAIANQANGRLNLDWGTGFQDFTTVTQLPFNFQVTSPNITFPTPITSLQISAFNGANTQVALFMDNLNLNVVAVPEPATMVLLSSALLGAGFLLHRHRRLHRVAQEKLVEADTQ